MGWDPEPQVTKARGDGCPGSLGHRAEKTTKEGGSGWPLAIIFMILLKYILYTFWPGEKVSQSARKPPMGQVMELSQIGDTQTDTRALDKNLGISQKTGKKGSQ